MLYTCRYVRHIWQTLNDLLNVNIGPIYILCGHHSIPDFIITLISYIIHKEYIGGEINNTERLNTICIISFQDNCYTGTLLLICIGLKEIYKQNV